MLFYILNNLTYENTATIPQQKIICSDLNLSQKQVSISINKLIEKKLFLKLISLGLTLLIQNFFILVLIKKQGN